MIVQKLENTATFIYMLVSLAFDNLPKNIWPKYKHFKHKRYIGDLFQPGTIK